MIYRVACGGLSVLEESLDIILCSLYFFVFFFPSLYIYIYIYIYFCLGTAFLAFLFLFLVLFIDSLLLKKLFSSIEYINRLGEGEEG